jgi:enoyl-CoA hydratase/carnithine racemase
MTEMPPPILVTTARDGAVLTLTLGAPPAHPLSRAMIAALQAALDDATGDATVKAIVLHGPGRIFCAGHDMKEIARHRADPDQGRAYLRDLFEACSALMQALAQSPKPTIAVVEGLATAGGLQLAAACDLVFAGPDARVCLPGVANGGFCTTPAVAVGRAIPRKPLMELLLSGETFDARWAQANCLFNRVLPAADLLPHARAFAAKLATRHAAAIAAGKATLDAQLGLPLAEAYAVATETMLGHFMDPTRIARDLDGWSEKARR